MINILILEDEKLLLNHYKSIVENTFSECQVHIATTGKKAVSIVKKHQIDLMLLDMELDNEKKVLGLDYANMISCIQPRIEFMIISGYSDYLKDAGDVQPFYYFMKPIDDAFLSRKLMEWDILRNKVEAKSNTLKLQTESGLAIVPTNKICYIEKMNRKVRIVTVTNEYIFRDSLKNMTTKVDDHFYHSHQSFLINMDTIESLDLQEDRTWAVSFKDIEDTAILSRYKAKEFFEIFDRRTES